MKTMVKNATAKPHRLPLDDRNISDQIWDLQWDLNMVVDTIEVAQNLSTGTTADSIDSESVHGMLNLILEHLRPVKTGLEKIQEELNPVMPRNNRKRHKGGEK